MFYGDRMNPEARGAVRPVRVMVVAGETRAQFLLDELRRGVGVEEYACIEESGALQAAVERGIWDVVLSDWTFTRFSTLAVLDSLHELHRPIPLVVVSGRIGEEAVAEAMRAGARDFVPAEDFARLNAVIIREVTGDTSARNLREVLRSGLLAHAGEIGITLANLDGLYFDANDAFLRLLGFTRDDLVAGRIHHKVIVPPDQEAEGQRVVASLKKGGTLGLRQGEYLRKDGTRVPVLLSGVRVGDGNVMGLFVLDVSEQRRVEGELRRTTTFLDSIVENIPLMVFVKDARELRFERFNRAAEEMLGHAREEMLGKNVYDHYPKEQADFFEAKDREALAGQSTVVVAEEPVTTPNGQRWLRTMKMAIRDERGVAQHLLGISEDITSKRELAQSLRRTEEQLQQAQKMDAIGQLAGGIAHDFNNVLSVILSYADMATRALADEDPVRGDIDEIAKACQRAADLTRQLLSFSRQQVAQHRTISLNDVIVRLDKMLRRVLEESIELRAATEPSLWRVSADPTQIEQVIMNLVVNAR